MHHATRSQSDELGDEYSELAGTENSGEQVTRQEFADEADLNKLLARFGVLTGDQMRPMTWGQEIDYNIDLQQALHAITEARGVEQTVPPELKRKYPTWRHVLNAVESGEYAYDLQQLREIKQKEAEEASKKQTDPSGPVS